MAKLGLMKIQSKTSLLFIGLRHKNSLIINFKQCNGFVEKYFYIDANEECVLNFNPVLTNGNVTVEVWDLNRNMILTLSNENKTEMLKSSTKSKYKLIFRFAHASGKVTFSWK